LTGKWGTGKSHLWQEIQCTSDDDTIQRALTVSLFGLSNIDQVKKRLLESVIGFTAQNPRLWDGVKNTVSSAIKVAEGFHKGFGALNDVGLILAPAVLKDKLIVVDDIERKHKDLSIDELLGFIDQYSQQYGSRFLLILNNDRLSDKDVWKSLHEKVVDQEVRLITSPTEAFSIAVELSPTQHSEGILRACSICGLTNIRVIRHVIRATNRILGSRSIADAISLRTIPSIVLLTAINYKAIEDGPDFAFVLTTNSVADLTERVEGKNKPQTAESNRKARWRLLLEELGINSCDDFETTVVQFLESGQFDLNRVRQIIERYEQEDRALDTRNRCEAFLETLHWDHRRSASELLVEATDFLSRVSLLSASSITRLDRALRKLPGGDELGKKLIDAWLADFRASDDRNSIVDFDHISREALHPDIDAEFRSCQDRIRNNMTVFDSAPTSGGTAGGVLPKRS
jgi:hypothetical protein